MIFRQWFEPVSSTYTYLLGCETTGEAVLIDPVMPTWERDLGLVRGLGLTLRYTVETHIHADHITSALTLRQRAGSRIAYPAPAHVACADVALEHGKPLVLGSLRLEPRHTPGHTDDHYAYVVGDRVFTGDALLIDGCGRTDFQNGDARTLYRSVHEQLFTLPDDTLVYPAHDYQHRRVSSIAQERARNPRLGGDHTLDDFLKIMAELRLPVPKFIDYAVPGNRLCGVCPEGLDADMLKYCSAQAGTPQG